MSQASDKKASRSHRPKPDRKGSVAARANWLVENVYPPGQRPFSAEQLAQAIRANGFEITPDYVRKILAGDRLGPRSPETPGQRPDIRYLEQLAYVFGTNLSFFTGDGEDPVDVEEMRDLAMLRSPRVRNLVTAVIRDRGLQEMVALIIDVPLSMRPVIADMTRMALQMRAQASTAGGDARPTVSEATSTDSEADREQNRAIRDWARAQGMKVSDRGRIPADVLQAYQAR